MTKTVRRAAAATGALLCAGTVVLGTATPAFATAYTPTLDGANWYWAGRQPAPAPAPVPGFPVPLPDQASNIPAGDVGVAYTNGPDKVTALQFGLASVPIGASFTAFTLTMPIDGQMLSAAPATLTACELLDHFADAPGPSSYDQVPTASSAACADGVYDAGKNSYAFALASLATDWALGTPVSGVLVSPKAGNTPFNYAFSRKAITLAADYTAPPAAPVTAQAPPVAKPPAPMVVPPAAVTFPAAVAPLPAIPVPAVVAAPVPQPQTAPAPLVVAPAAASAPLPPGELRPGGLFWLALAATAGLLLLLSAVLGDPLAPVPADPRRRRFAQVVQARAGGRPVARVASPRLPRPA